MRLVHALVRRRLIADGQWDTEVHGVPINQQDSLGTLTVFSTVLLDVLERAGKSIKRADQEAFWHLWRVVGHFLGIAHEHLPANLAGARALACEIREDQWVALA